jgi:hypothetical protein
MVIATPASQLFATSPVVKIAVFFLFTTYSIEIVAYSERLSTTLKNVSPGLGGWALGPTGQQEEEKLTCPSCKVQQVAVLCKRKKYPETRYSILRTADPLNKKVYQLRPLLNSR